MPSPANSNETGRDSGLPPTRTLMYAVSGTTRTGVDVRLLLPREFAYYLGVAGSQPLPEGVAGTLRETGRAVEIIPITHQEGVVEGRDGAEPAMEFLDPAEEVIREVMIRSASEEQPGPPPASEFSIEALKTVENESLARDAAVKGCTLECAVCQEELMAAVDPVASKRRAVEDGTTTAVTACADLIVKEMPCGHRYHGDCIKKWLRMNGSCPLCRYCMPENDEDS